MKQTLLTLIINLKAVRIFNKNYKSDKNKLKNKLDRNVDAESTRIDDKFNDFRNNSKSFKKSKNEIEDKRFNFFIYEKSKH